jgi:hypothetical protein
MKTIYRFVNLITYTGAICFLMSILIIGACGVKMLLIKIPIYFPHSKFENLTEWILWGGFMFMVFLSQQIIYKVWKEYLKL